MGGALALVVGSAVAALSVSAPAYTGPLAELCRGIDLSLLTGMLVTAAIYVEMMRPRLTTPGVSGAQTRCG